MRTTPPSLGTPTGFDMQETDLDFGYLQENLKAHVEFVKFIEAKCTAVMAAASGIFAVSGVAMLNVQTLEFRFLLGNVAVFTFLAIVILCCAYLPLDVRPISYNQYRATSENLFFFGDTARMTPEKILALWGAGTRE